MPAILATLGSVLASTLLSMFTKLMTEKFMKFLVVKALEAVVAKTDTKEDDELLAKAKKEWGLED